MEPGDRFCSSKDLCKRTNPSVGQVKGTRLVARLNRASWDLSSYLVPHGTFFLDLANFSVWAPLYMPARGNNQPMIFSYGSRRLWTNAFSFCCAAVLA
jgi:hypothetical protein